MLPARGLGLRHVVGAREAGAGDADDPRLRRDLAGREAPVQGRHQLARHEIAGAAEEQHIEGRKYGHASFLVRGAKG